MCGLNKSGLLCTKFEVLKSSSQSFLPFCRKKFGRNIVRPLAIGNYKFKFRATWGDSQWHTTDRKLFSFQAENSTKGKKYSEFWNFKFEKFVASSFQVSRPLSHSHFEWKCRISCVFFSISTWSQIGKISILRLLT